MQISFPATNFSKTNTTTMVQEAIDIDSLPTSRIIPYHRFCVDSIILERDNKPRVLLGNRSPEPLRVARLTIW
tara:strand:+ start:856 stop:1074 length:219 start_codon:yes stop_codon:yes gene_type:complete